MYLSQILNAIWQPSIFHYTIFLLLLAATVAEVYYLIRTYIELQASQSRISHLEKFVKQARNDNQNAYRIPRSDKHFRWFANHLDGEWSGDNFLAKLRHGDSILLQYPMSLSRSAEVSPLRFVPGILIAIGVLGTFYGIQSGLSQMSLSDIGRDSQELLSSSVQLLEGMKTAFSTSLLGLGTSSLFTIVLFASQLLRRQHLSQLRRRLDRVAFLESPERLLSRLDSEATAQAARTLQEAADGIRQLNPEAIGNAVGDSMKPTFYDIKAALGDLRGEISKDREELLTTLVREQEERLITPIIAELKESNRVTQETNKVIRATAKAVNRLNQELGEVVLKLSGAIETIQRFQTETLEELQNFANDLREILGGFRSDVQQTLKEVAEQIQASVDEGIRAMQAQQKAFEESAKQAAETFRGIRQELEQALEKQGAEQRQLLTEFTDIMKVTVEEQKEVLVTAGREASALMSGASEKLESTLTNIDEQLQKTRETVQIELERFRLQYQDALEKFFEEQDRVLEETLGKQRDGLKEVLDKTKEIFEAEYERRKEIGEQLDSQITRTTTFVNSVGLTSGERLAQLESITKNLGGEAERIDAAYASLIERLNAGLEESNKHLTEELKLNRNSSVEFFTQADNATAKLSSELLKSANYLVAASSVQKNGSSGSNQ